MKRGRIMMTRHWAGALLALTLSAPAARAGPIVLYETGFEASEGFVAGQALVGQGGFVARLGLNPDAATVTTGNPATGNQAVRIDGALLTDPNPVGVFAGGYYPLLNYDTVANGTPIIEVSVDLLLVVLNDVEPAIGAGVSAYDDQGNSYNAGFLGGPDAPAGEYGYFNVRVVYDFVSRTSSIFIDGVPGETASIPTDGNIINPAIFAFGEEAPPSDFVAYFDNFRVTAVPEPSSVVLMSSGGVLLVGMAMRYHRRRPVRQSS
jgi:hypothetical protein